MREGTVKQTGTKRGKQFECCPRLCDHNGGADTAFCILTFLRLRNKDPVYFATENEQNANGLLSTYFHYFQNIYTKFSLTNYKVFHTHTQNSGEYRKENAQFLLTRRLPSLLDIPLQTGEVPMSQDKYCRVLPR